MLIMLADVPTLLCCPTVFFRGVWRTWCRFRCCQCTRSCVDWVPCWAHQWSLSSHGWTALSIRRFLSSPDGWEKLYWERDWPYAVGKYHWGGVLWSWVVCSSSSLVCTTWLRRLGTHPDLVFIIVQFEFCRGGSRGNLWNILESNGDQFWPRWDVIAINFDPHFDTLHYAELVTHISPPPEQAWMLPHLRSLVVSSCSQTILHWLLSNDFTGRLNQIESLKGQTCVTEHVFILTTAESSLASVSEWGCRELEQLKWITIWRSTVLIVVIIIIWSRSIIVTAISSLDHGQ